MTSWAKRFRWWAPLAASIRSDAWAPAVSYARALSPSDAHPCQGHAICGVRRGAMFEPMRCARTVHVWSADLSSAPLELGELLCAQEHKRASQMRDERGRQRWIVARGLLRTLLGERTGADPAALRFQVGEHGKLSLALPAVCFNVSHSGDLALYAICDSCEVGIDVEVGNRRPGGRRDDVAVARRMLGGAVAERLAALPKPQRAEEFLKAWVAHEARVKCLGVGIGHRMPGAGAVEGGSEPDGEPWVCELEAGPGAYAALAVQGGPAEVVQRVWGAGAAPPDAYTEAP